MTMEYQPFSARMPKFHNGLRVVELYCANAPKDGRLWRIDYKPNGAGFPQYGVDYRGDLNGDGLGKPLKVLNDMVGTVAVTAEAVRSHPGAKGWVND